MCKIVCWIAGRAEQSVSAGPRAVVCYRDLPGNDPTVLLLTDRAGREGRCIMI